MKRILIGVSLLAVGCSGESLQLPTSPSAAAGVERAVAPNTRVVNSALRAIGERPFRGSLTANEVDIVQFPTLVADGSAEGTATHLGRYTAEFNATVNLLDGTATGNYTFIAANKDQLLSTFTGLGLPAGEGMSSIVETLTITGGTGRFEGASGTLLIRRTLVDATGTSSGSIEGTIVLTQ